jgi:hypothetical protein
LEDCPIKRLLAPIVVALASLLLVPAAFACLAQPTKSGVSTAHRTIRGVCHVHPDYRWTSHLYVHCYGSSSADIQYSFTVPKKAHGIVGNPHYDYADYGVTKRVTRSGIHVTVIIHVSAWHRADIRAVGIQYYP